MAIKNSVFIIEFEIGGLEMDTQVKAPNLEMAYNVAVELLHKVFGGKMTYKIKGCYDRENFSNYIVF